MVLLLVFMQLTRDLFAIAMFLYVYVARAYTLASTIGAIVQYCLRNQENPHISVRLWAYTQLLWQSALNT